MTDHSTKTRPLTVRELRDRIAVLDHLTEDDLQQFMPEGEEESTFGFLKRWYDPAMSDFFFNLAKIDGREAVAITSAPFFFNERVPTDNAKLFIFTDHDAELFNDWYVVPSEMVMRPDSAYLFEQLQGYIDDAVHPFGLRIRHYKIGENMPDPDMPENFWINHGPNQVDWVVGSYYIGSTLYFKDETDAISAKLRTEAGIR